MMQAPQIQVNPFIGVNNPSVPHTTGGVFVAWGWFRNLVNNIMPEYIADMEHYGTIGNGILV